jgi:hypothetical protein
MLHDRRRAIGSHIGDRHAVLFRRLEIDVIRTRGSDTNQLEMRTVLDQVTIDRDLVGDNDLGAVDALCRLVVKGFIVQGPVAVTLVQCSQVEVIPVDAFEIEKYTAFITPLYETRSSRKNGPLFL